MPFGKKYRKAVEGLDLSQRFSVEEAVEKSLCLLYTSDAADEL